MMVFLGRACPWRSVADSGFFPAKIAEVEVATTELTVFRKGPLEAKVNFGGLVAAGAALTAVVPYSGYEGPLWLLLLPLSLLLIAGACGFFCGRLYESCSRKRKRVNPVSRAWVRLADDLLDREECKEELGRHAEAVKHCWSERSKLGNRIRKNQVATLWTTWNLISARIKAHPWHRARQRQLGRRDS